MKTAFAFALILAAACGNKSSQPAKPAGEAHAEHGQMMPEIAKFHDVLAPRWHADKGEKRMTDTCAASAEFHAGADALAKAQLPATADRAKWDAGAKELSESVGALDASCSAKDAAAFELAFAKMHTNFHALMETSGGGHDEHAEHGEQHDEHGEHHDKM
jgi:hypothetical protein